MRALRILLIVVVVLGGLFVAADRIALYFSEQDAADRLRSTEGLSKTPDVSIHGFPFLTQLAGGTFDDVEVSMSDYEADAAGGKPLRIASLNARLHGVTFSGDYSSATADTATGTARVDYDELLKAAHVKPVQLAPGVKAKVIGLSDGGQGKIKVAVEATVLGRTLPRPVMVMSTARVTGDEVTVHADSLPKLGGVPLAEEKAREITDFQQQVTGLPDGIHIKSVQAASDGVHIAVKGSHVKLAN
ncbi:DUF2993 domain-containing protein [Streptomyces sp. NPDC058045]|uniref:LmeA family phospholipid-binding protein n=1 Tax=Streptomyces sp. NPDC058045 TaxID=3346311 RepID=UPI0036EB58B1